MQAVIKVSKDGKPKTNATCLGRQGLKVALIVRGVRSVKLKTENLNWKTNQNQARTELSGISLVPNGFLHSTHTDNGGPH